MTLNQTLARAEGAARDAAAEVIAAIEWTRAARHALHRGPAPGGDDARCGRRGAITAGRRDDPLCVAARELLDAAPRPFSLAAIGFVVGGTAG